MPMRAGYQWNDFVKESSQPESLFVFALAGGQLLMERPHQEQKDVAQADVMREKKRWRETRAAAVVAVGGEMCSS